MKPAPNDKAPPPRRLLVAVLERVGLALAMSASFAVIWWSVDRLGSAQRHTADLGQQAARLASEIDVMRGQWPAGSTQAVLQRYSQASEALFQTPEAIAAWHDTLREDAIPLALDPTLALAETRQTNAGSASFTVIAANLEVRPADGIASDRPAYRRVLQFTHALASQPRRLDLVQLSVEGGSNSVSKAQATVELWTPTPEPPKP